MWTVEPDVDGLRLAQGVALALAGTVPIPSPVPAVAVVLLGRTPEAAPARDLPRGGDYYVRIVQFPGPHVILSRYVAVEDVRLIKGLIAGKGEGRGHAPEDEPEKLFGAALLAAVEALKPAIVEEGGAGEQLLATKAVVYVREGARVQVRVDLVTTAEESDIPTLLKTCCECCPGHLLPW